jgi:hypothetical protein
VGVTTSVLGSSCSRLSFDIWPLSMDLKRQIVPQGVE